MKTTAVYIQILRPLDLKLWLCLQTEHFRGLLQICRITISCGAFSLHSLSTATVRGAEQLPLAAQTLPYSDSGTKTQC